MTSFNDETNTGNQLDPWRVILACLFELESHEIPEVIDRSGMAVDWSLTERQDYSHKYRKAAYRPRINKSYEALPNDDKLRVAFIVSEELARRGLTDILNEKLHKIGWKIVAGNLVPVTSTAHQLFFPQGTQHDAYVHIKKIIRKAKYSLLVIDPYLDGTIFTILGDDFGPQKIKFMTSKLPSDFVYESKVFQRQYPEVLIELRKTRNFHDRFIIIDDTMCWHIGCSIKDAGNKSFMMSMIEDPQNTEALLKTLSSTW